MPEIHDAARLQRACQIPSSRDRPFPALFSLLHYPRLSMNFPSVTNLPILPILPVRPVQPFLPVLPVLPFLPFLPL